MATRQQPTRATGQYQRADQVEAESAEANRLADEALRHYGEPTITLEELQTMLDEQLKGISLSDVVLEDRRAGW